MALVACPRETGVAVEAYGIFPLDSSKFRIMWLLCALVASPCACRLCKLAQTGFPGRSAWHFPKKNSTEWLLWHVHVHFDCAGSRKTGVPAGASSIFLVNFRAAWLLWRVPRDLFYRELVQGLAKRPLLQILPRGFVQKSCHQTSHRDLVQKSCQETFYGHLAQRPGEESRCLFQKSSLESLAWTAILL